MNTLPPGPPNRITVTPYPFADTEEARPEQVVVRRVSPQDVDLLEAIVDRLDRMDETLRRILHEVKQ